MTERFRHEREDKETDKEKGDMTKKREEFQQPIPRNVVYDIHHSNRLLQLGPYMSVLYSYTCTCTVILVLKVPDTYQENLWDITI